MKRVTIIGGGLAGLIAAIQFARVGISCTVVEKKAYPFHRVCGEYVSNEVVPFLKSQDLYPHQYNPPQIQKFQLSSINGKSKIMALDMGGFGISRFAFDNFLFEQATRLGVEFFLNEEVLTVRFSGEKFMITTQQQAWESSVVIGAFGKRSKLDHYLKRPLLEKRSPYIGVKYHVRTQHPNELIALHNFPGGYCGISNVEEGKTTLCYLSHRDNLKRSRTIQEMEENIVFRNPLLREVFKNSEFLFEKPEVINEISFATKSPVEDHVLMAGDAAGMIAPLCGNGMAMAIHSALLLSNAALRFLNNKCTREQLERDYAATWRIHFENRLRLGRQVQMLFGKEFTSRLAVSLMMNIRPLARTIMRRTHGEIF